VKVFISTDPRSLIVTVLIRAEGTRIIGDLVRTIGPRERFLSRDHAEWVAMGDGQHEIEANRE
jgi:hypothetical protein